MSVQSIRDHVNKDAKIQWVHTIATVGEDMGFHLMEDHVMVSISYSQETVYAVSKLFIHYQLTLFDSISQTIECGGTLNVSEGVITSPAYPSPYPPKQNCEWKIYIHPDHYLNVTLTNVDILGDQTDKCRDTHVKPYDSNFRFNRRLCGHYKRITYLVKRSGTYSRVRFRTFDNNGRGTGFSLHFRQVRINELTNQELNYVKIDTKTIPYRELWT